MLQIKDLREEKDLRQQDIAKLIGIERSTYSSYETERDTIPINHLNNLCNFFDVSIDYALGLTKKTKYSNSRKDIDRDIILIRLKELRKKYKLTQHEIVKKLNIARSTWAGYEYGNYLIPTLILYELASKYNTSVDYIVGKVDINYLAK